MVMTWCSTRTSTQTNNLEELEGDFLPQYVLDKKLDNEKCPLTLLEMSMQGYEKKKPPPIKLKELAKLYPGDKFTDITGTTECSPEADDEVCDKLTREGHCTGTNIKVSNQQPTHAATSAIYG